MAHTRLFGYLQRAMALARAEHETGHEIDPETFDPGLPLVSRRQFLQRTGAVVAGVAAAAALPDFAVAATNSASAPRIVVVGAGLSGLTTAYQLRKAGYGATIYEVAERVGGRTWSRPNAFGDGMVIELGGELIDTPHTHLLGLAKELGLDVVDLHRAEGKTEERYLFGGRTYTISQAAKAFAPLYRTVKRDLDQLTDDVTYHAASGGRALDHLPLSEWLTTRIGPRGYWLRDLLDVAYTIEYGRDTSEQSSLNLLYLLGYGYTPGAFQLYGASDERYRIAGGNDQVARRLAARLPEGTIRSGYCLVAIREDRRGGPYTLSFQYHNKIVDVVADKAIITVPFTMLRQCDLSKVSLSAVKRRAIRELGYGLAAKLIVPFNRRVWTEQGSNGSTLADTGYQATWDTSRGQPGKHGILVNFVGATSLSAMAQGTPSDRARDFLQSIEPLIPGLTEAWRGTAFRMYWPKMPYVKAAYACYLVGQYTSIAGSESEQEGNLHFAGEHTSYEFLGYMNGAVESGQRAAAEIVADLRRQPAIRP